MSVKTRKVRLSERLANVFDLPKDVVMDLPRFSLLGNRQIIIENHKGIIEYTAQLVRLNTSRGEVVVAGRSIVVQSITPDELIIEGRINSVQYVDWGMA